MQRQTYTLQLDGSVSLERLTTALDAWYSALHTLAVNLETAHEPEITIEDLGYGSAVIDVALDFGSYEDSYAYSKAYGEYGRAVQSGDLSTVGHVLQESVRHLITAARLDEAQSLRLLSDDADILVLPDEWTETESLNAEFSFGFKPTHSEALGMLTGKLQSLSSRNGLRFSLYDSVFDKAVRGTLSSDQRDSVGELWNKHVVVSGLIRRDTETGQPLSIRQVTAIAESKEPANRYKWMRAKGALKSISPSMSSEHLIRQARDG